MCPSRVVVSTDWVAPGEGGSLVIVVGSDISQGVTPFGLAAFLDLDLKNN